MEPSLLGLYRIAVDEYRFQVDLNWQRTQHWFTLNLAIASVAIGLLRVSTDPGTNLLVGAIFGCGALASIVAAIALNAQHDYYRSVRNHKDRLEHEMGLGRFALRTTPGMRGERRVGVKRLRRVTTLYTGLLVAVAAVDAGGVAYALCAAL